MIEVKIPSFLDCFQSLTDPRSNRNRVYTMGEILLTTLCACICGADGWQDVEDFGKMQVDFLKTFLPYENGIPSDDTFRRFFRALNPKEFQKLFCDWAKLLNPEVGSVIAIDGKSSRRSFDNDKDMLHMVSAYATEARIVLGQTKVSEKSNEITAIPKLLEHLDLRGSTITIDAMGCQYEIANQILSKGSQYIFALKGNQSSLHDDVKFLFDDVNTNEIKNSHETFEKSHGRLETRRCFVVTDIDWLREKHPRWDTAQSIVRIDSTRQLKGNTTKETKYYISSCHDNAETFLYKIRSHWAIENSLHWTLDMSFGDDQSRIRKHNAPQIMAIIRHAALNLLQMQKRLMPRQSIKRLRKMAGWSYDFLRQVLCRPIQSFS